VILISDTGMISNTQPSITTGLRGLSYVEVEVTGPNRDLHSGLYGGAVANPINVLTKMIASLHDENNHITIPGFYDKVEELSVAERAEMAKAPFSLEKYKEALAIDEVYGEAGYVTNERNSIRPTLDVNGIWGEPVFVTEATNGTKVRKDYTYKIRENFRGLDYAVIAYIMNADTYEILQVMMVEP
jgi:acetylornithine deacetylase/succinyl-diaminopimelate desuccinylase-like protein